MSGNFEPTQMWQPCFSFQSNKKTFQSQTQVCANRSHDTIGPKGKGGGEDRVMQIKGHRLLSQDAVGLDPRVHRTTDTTETFLSHKLRMRTVLRCNASPRLNNSVQN